MENSKKISLGLLALTGCMTLSSHAAVVINEVDYDQPGTDSAEFIELFNTGSVVNAAVNPLIFAAEYLPIKKQLICQYFIISR